MLEMREIISKCFQIEKPNVKYEIRKKQFLEIEHLLEGY